MRAVLVLSLLLAIPPAAAGVVVYDSSSGEVTYEWGDPQWIPAADGTWTAAWPVLHDGTTHWVDDHGRVLATGTTMQVRPDLEDQPAWSALGAAPEEVASTRLSYTPAAVPCALTLRPDIAQVAQACTVGGRTVAPGTPIGDAPEAVHVDWAHSIPQTISFRGAEERLVEGDGWGERLPEDTRPGPAWETAAPAPWGPDESSVDHTWSRRDAYEAALADPTLDLQAWVLGRDVWPQAGRGAVIDDGVRRDESWWFTLTDGEETFSFGVRRTNGSPLVETWRSEEVAALPASARPTEWPTVATLLARLEHQAGAEWDMEATYWGYRWEDGAWVFDISHDRSTGDAPDWHHEEATLHIDGDGRAISYEDQRPGTPRPFSFEAAPTLAPTGEPLSRPPVDVPFIPVAGTVGLTAIAIWALWPLFSRIRREHLLDHPARRRIHDAVADAPGIHLSALRRETALANGTLIHHVSKMEKAGLLRAQRSDGHTTYTIPDDYAPWHRFLPLIRSDAARRIGHAIATGPATIRDISAASGASAAAVRWHLGRMQTAGMVRRSRMGAAYVYDLSPDAHGIAEALR